MLHGSYALDIRLLAVPNLPLGEFTIHSPGLVRVMAEATVRPLLTGEVDAEAEKAARGAPVGV